MDLSDVRNRATLSITETSELLELGINQTYAAVREGSIPALRLGRSYRVPVPALLALLGETPDMRQAPPDSDARAQIFALDQEKEIDGHHDPAA
jgi:excisionase family DNA binding protein